MADKHFEIQKLRLTMARATDQMREEILRLRGSGIPENAWPREEGRIRQKYDSAIRGSAARINALTSGE